MRDETLYIDLDHAKVTHTREGVEVTAETGTVVLNGTGPAFEHLAQAALSVLCMPAIERGRQ